jgi:hypothetical protein
MMRRHMRTALRAVDVARFRPDLTFRALDDGFAVTTYGGTITFQGSEIMRAAGAAVASGDRTCGDIVIDLEDRHGWPAAETMDFLNDLFADGLLDEEPIGPFPATSGAQQPHAGQVPRPAEEVPA